MRNLAIIPARSGSKGLKDKNIKLLKGIPLMAYSIDAAKKTELFSDIVVSTDSKKYAEIARIYGAEAPFLRSSETSNDSASSWDVVLEVLNQYLNKGEKFDSVCLLQPTSPLRTEIDIIDGYNLLKYQNADSVTSVCECDHSPIWCMTLNNDLSLKSFREKLKDLPRQNLPIFYRINGAIYIRKIEYYRENIILRCDDEYALVMDREKSVDIDTNLDFVIAETMMNIY